MQGEEEGADDKVIQRVLAGRINDFEILLNRYRGYVWTIVSGLLPREAVEEMAHEVFVEAYRSLARYDGRKPLKNWLAGIALHRCRDHWRQVQRNREIPLSALDETHQHWLDQAAAGDAGEVTAGIAARAEAAEILDRVLAELSVNDRLVLTLVHMEGFSIKEVAAMLDWSVINVKVRAYRSRTKMRKRITALLAQRSDHEQH